MTTYQYQQITARRSHRGKCPGCGKTVTRSRTFSQTVNPFHKNADGSVKTPDEVRESVNREADAWVPDFAHCEGEIPHLRTSEAS